MNRILSFNWLRVAPRYYASNIAKPDKPAVRPKTPKVPKINLLIKEKQTETTLAEAQKLANRRDLHLVEVEKYDTKSQRPTYRLLTKTEMLQQIDVGDNSEPVTKEQLKASHEKPVKNLTINSRISEHDLKVRLTQISKWLIKGNEVRILLQSNEESSNSENICKVVEQSIKEPKLIGKMIRKSGKGGMIRLNLIPQTENAIEISDNEVKKKS